FLTEAKTRQNPSTTDLFRKLAFNVIDRRFELRVVAVKQRPSSELYLFVGNNTAALDLDAFRGERWAEWVQEKSSGGQLDEICIQILADGSFTYHVRPAN